MANVEHTLTEMPKTENCTRRKNNAIRLAYIKQGVFFFSHFILMLKDYFILFC